MENIISEYVKNVNKHDKERKTYYLTWSFNFLTQAIHPTRKRRAVNSMLDCGEEEKEGVLSRPDKVVPKLESS